jgi:hypothetical protein
MEEVQILLLLAYLAIGLMSITIPTYAISVSYLARETLRTIKDMERRRDLNQKLDELRKRLKQESDVNELKQEISRYEEEEKQLKERLECLSAKGAVGYPFGSFASSLFFAALGVYDFPNRVDLYILASVLLIVYGLHRFGKSVLAIEQAALAPGLPTFKVGFLSGTSTERYKVGEEKDITFYIINYRRDLAEDLSIMVFFRPEFDLVKKGIYYTISKQYSTSLYPNHNAACFEGKLMHMNLRYTYTVSVKMPQNPDTYRIPVHILERRTGLSEHQLTIEITSCE